MVQCSLSFSCCFCPHCLISETIAQPKVTEILQNFKSRLFYSFILNPTYYCAVSTARCFK